MRLAALAALLIATQAPSAGIAQSAPTAPAAAAGHYTVDDTDIGTLLDDPAAKAIVDRHVPGFSSGAQIDMARSLTLKSVQQYAPDQLSDKALADIQAEFNKLPAKK